jgi:peptidyl-tRNA hydrolase, PTH1 family
VDGGALIVGLGNPGPHYSGTRHNIGFMVLDELASRAGVFSWHEKHSGLESRAIIATHSCTLLKPQTFMNLSGRSVSRAAQFFHYESQDIIVVHDEVDLEFGDIRVKNGGGTAGHKGLKSIKQDIGNTDFLRIRFGVGRPQHGSVSDFVLDTFSAEENISLLDTIKRATDVLEFLVGNDFVRTMNRFNKKGVQKDES